MLETLMMGVMGLVLGAIGGVILTSWFSVNGLSIPGMEEMAATFNLPPRMYPRVSFLTTILGPAVVLVFTLFAALYPALRLQRLHPVEAMRAT